MSLKSWFSHCENKNHNILSSVCDLKNINFIFLCHFCNILYVYFLLKITKYISDNTYVNSSFLLKVINCCFRIYEIQNQSFFCIEDKFSFTCWKSQFQLAKARWNVWFSTTCDTDHVFLAKSWQNLYVCDGIIAI